MSRRINRLSSHQLAEIESRLEANKRLRRRLPGDGRIHIDRQLPFIAIYRRPPGRPDPGMEQMVHGWPSYAVAPGDRAYHAGFAELIEKVAAILGKEFGAFLIIELWAAPHDPLEQENGAELCRPRFRVVSAGSATMASTLERLVKELRRIRLLKHRAKVEMGPSAVPVPPGLRPLFRLKKARQLNCFQIGIELSPVFRDDLNGELYPSVHRRLQRALLLALRRTCFAFSHARTSHAPPHIHSLGRRAMVKAVWQVDSQLAEINDAFDFLLLLTPTNSDSAWASFRRRKFNTPPEFQYRLIPLEPALLKRRLFSIPIERVEDPTLEFLFSQKRLELDRQLSLLEVRNSKDFLYGSLQLYGSVEEDLLELAQSLLSALPPRSRDDSRRGYLPVEQFAALANAEIANFRSQYADIRSTVEIRPDVTGLMVSRGNLLIGRQSRIPGTRAEALIQHEVGTHALTYWNGLAQPFKQLHCGLSGYDELQEGLAVFAEYLVGGLSRPRLRLLAARVIAARMLAEGAAFIDLFRELNTRYGFEKRTAFTVAMRTCRAGGLTKDATYLRGLTKVVDYIRKGGKLLPLFVGKIAAEHVPIVEELQWRKVLRPPPLQPAYLDSPEAMDRLQRVRQGLRIIDLVQRRPE